MRGLYPSDKHAFADISISQKTKSNQITRFEILVVHHYSLVKDKNY